MAINTHRMPHVSPWKPLLPKAQVSPLRSHPPAPYLADRSLGPGASVPAPAPKLRQASLPPPVGTNASRARAVGAGTMGPPQPLSSPITALSQSVPARPSASQIVLALEDFQGQPPGAWCLLPPSAGLPAKKPRPTCPRRLCAPRSPRFRTSDVSSTRMSRGHAPRM